MIDKINHYALESNPTVYDEESLTALQLIARTTGKVNECVEQVNELPRMVSDDVQKHINNGDFDKQINKYAGELEDHISEVDKKHSVNLNNEVEALKNRIDNIVSNAGDGSIPTEVVDARLDGMGRTHGSLHTAIQEQAKQMTNVQNGFAYLGGNNCANLIVNNDGSVSVESNGRWTYRGSFGTITFDWSTICVNIADHVETMYESEGVIYRVRINIPTYHTLVLNMKDKLLYLRNHAVCDAYDMVLVQNSYGNPVRGVIVDEWVYRNILENHKNAYTVRGAYLYGGEDFKMEFRKDEDTPALDVTMYGRPTLCYGSDDAYLCDFDGDAIESIKENVSYPNDIDIIATIKIPGWCSLVFNHIDKRWHFRYRGNLQNGDILAIATGYCQPLCGTLLDEWSTRKNMEFAQYIGTESLGYNPPNGVKEFNSLINGKTTVEKFLWFTDPHLCEGADWQAEFETYKKHLKACYDATPTTFAVCGGDWLGNGDTQAEACFKLGFIEGQMTSIFRDKYYPVVGNHDTNYQGVLTEGASANTGLLDKTTIRNLWVRDYKILSPVYSFDGENTRFFVFDSELDWDLSMNDYKIEQLFWFCEELAKMRDGNVVAFIHIYYNYDGTSNQTSEMGKKITEIANAFNERSSYTLMEGLSFDFSNTGGKFRFVLAGHNHGDSVTIEDNIPVILTTDTRDNGTPTFDLCLADYDNNKLHLCRVGSGESRVVDI